MGEFIFLSILNEQLLYKVGPISMLIIGYLVEKEFISRPALFANTVSLNVYLALSGTDNFFLACYSNIGLFLGVIGIIAYSQKESLPSLFYTIGFAYNSILVGVIILIV